MYVLGQHKNFTNINIILLTIYLDLKVVVKEKAILL